jgi:hypothetical protein
MKRNKLVAVTAAVACAGAVAAFAVVLVRREVERTRESIRQIAREAAIEAGREAGKEVGKEVRAGIVECVDSAVDQAVNQAADRAAELPAQMVRQARDEIQEAVGGIAGRVNDRTGDLPRNVLERVLGALSEPADRLASAQPRESASPGTPVPARPQPVSTYPETDGQEYLPPEESRPAASEMASDGTGEPAEGEIEVVREINDVLGQPPFGMTPESAIDFGLDIPRRILGQF